MSIKKLLAFSIALASVHAHSDTYHDLFLNPLEDVQLQVD